MSDWPKIESNIIFQGAGACQSAFVSDMLTPRPYTGVVVNATSVSYEFPEPAGPSQYCRWLSTNERGPDGVWRPVLSLYDLYRAVSIYRSGNPSPWPYLVEIW